VLVAGARAATICESRRYFGLGAELVSDAPFFDFFDFLLAFFDFLDIFAPPEELARGVSPAVVGAVVVGGIVEVSLEPVCAKAPDEARANTESATTVARIISISSCSALAPARTAGQLFTSNSMPVESAQPVAI
jgi:hypothetical protein